ncbi:Protein of unknown function [Gryllus bimaculatus]|nr:Protein of unknown function [Gryllus bimaculatus]
MERGAQRQRSGGQAGRSLSLARARGRYAERGVGSRSGSLSRRGRPAEASPLSSLAVRLALSGLRSVRDPPGHLAKVLGWH